MPQPDAVFLGFPCEQPTVQRKQDRRKLSAAAAGAGAFRELVANLVVEHERVLAENARLQAASAAPRAQPAPWETGVGAQERGAGLAGDLPVFPLSTAGRPVLASERQSEHVELGAPGSGGEPWGRGFGGTARGGLVDSSTQTVGDGEEEVVGAPEEIWNRASKWRLGARDEHVVQDAKGACDEYVVQDAKGACDEYVIQSAGDGDEHVIQSAEDGDEHVIQSSEKDHVRAPSKQSHGAQSQGGQSQGSYVPPPRTGGLKRGESFSSHVSSASACIRRYSANGRKLSKKMTAVYMIVEDGESSKMAFWYKIVMQTLLFISVGTPVLQMLDPPVISGLAAAVIETFFDTMFTVELLIRWYVSPAPRVFFCHAFNILDLISPVAVILRCVGGFVIDLEDPLSALAIFLLCFTPILRLLRMLRRWDTIHLLAKAFIDVFEALPVLLFPLLAITLLFSTLIYIAEPRDNIPTLATAVWLTMVTMTTVGYGDVTPVSVPGSFIVGTLVISSVMYMAMPVAILGSSFTTVWQDRDTVMLLHRTKERLLQWGYSVHDIPVLFQVFDKDSSGELNMKEFVRMMKTMRLGLKDEQILSLFKAFDGDGSGEIDDKEFVRILFPNKFVEVYGTDDDPEVDLIIPMSPK